MNGAGMFSSICSARYYSFPADLRTKIPELCATASTVPESFLQETFTTERQGRKTSEYQVLITAGLEKLEASTGAASTITGAQATGTGDSALTRSATTGAAAPMRTVAPMLMCWGVAVAALVL